MNERLHGYSQSFRIDLSAGSPPMTKTRTEPSGGDFQCLTHLPAFGQSALATTHECAAT